MKCARCGKEFGSGTSCQNCGIDRVTGLGNYNGYYGQSPNLRGDPHNNSQMTVCYYCGEIIPNKSQFCPICSNQLWVKCPKCGCEYPSQFLICNHCGTNRKQYLQEQKRNEERQQEENQREQKIKYEAECLKGEKSVIWPYYLFAIVWIFFLFVIDSHPRDSSWENIFIKILVGLLCYGFAKVFCYTARSEKIKKWIEKHPNDPRCKYL